MDGFASSDSRHCRKNSEITLSGIAGLSVAENQILIAVPADGVRLDIQCFAQLVYHVAFSLKPGGQADIDLIGAVRQRSISKDVAANVLAPILQAHI